jgi:outer membrane protein assembly factor BamA
VRDLPGFGEHYNLITTRAQLKFDSRHPARNRSRGSGVRLLAFGSYSLDPGDTDLQFVNWGGELATFWDVTGLNHVLAMRLYLEAQETIGSRPIPFHHRVTLGGNERLRGFVEGRYRGDSAFVLTLQYRYPIWWMLDASLFVSVGNVFSGRFADFAYERLVASWGLGVRTNNSRNVSFDVLLAFGSNLIGRWHENFALQHVRLVLGVNHGF